MDYKLDFYIGINKDEAEYLGHLLLKDDYTYRHYANLIDKRYRFWVSFESCFQKFPHGYAAIDETTIKAKMEENNEKKYLLIINNRNNVHFFTNEEWSNTERIDTLIKGLDAKRISDLLKK